VWRRVLRGRWSRQLGHGSSFRLELSFRPSPQATTSSGHLLFGPPSPREMPHQIGKCPIRMPIKMVHLKCPIKSIFPHQKLLIRNPSSGTPHQGLLIRDSSRPGSPAHHHLDHSQLRTGSRLPVALKVRALKVHLAEKSDRRNQIEAGAPLPPDRGKTSEIEEIEAGRPSRRAGGKRRELKKLKSGISRAKSRVSRKGSRRARGKLKKLKLPELKLSTASQMRHAGRACTNRPGPASPDPTDQPRSHRAPSVGSVGSGLSGQLCQLGFIGSDLFPQIG
jgi:hypothetical protein